MARILVIDDEERIRKLLHTVLKRKGHEVYLAGSGQKGIDVFERTRPLITILDLQMPDVNGIEVLRRLRAIDPQACVIMLTGHGTEEEEAKALTLGADDFLNKGLSLFELGEALRRTMARMSKDPVLTVVAPDRGAENGGRRRHTETGRL
jgi:DNA-binding response OmpR family regulator